MYVTAIAYETSLYRTLLQDPEHEQREVERLAERFAAIDAERYPTIAALAPAMTLGDGDERFELGMDVHHQRPARDADRGPPHRDAGSGAPRTGQALATGRPTSLSTMPARMHDRVTSRHGGSWGGPRVVQVFLAGLGIFGAESFEAHRRSATPCRP